LIPVFGLKRFPEIWGCNGFERLMPDGYYEVGNLDSYAMKALAKAEDWIREDGLEDLCERRPAGFALNWPHLSPEMERVTRARMVVSLNLLAKEAGLQMRESDKGVELWAHARDRRFVVETLFEEMDR